MTATKHQLDDLDAALEKEADKLEAIAKRLEEGAGAEAAAEELRAIASILRGTIEKDQAG